MGVGAALGCVDGDVDPDEQLTGTVAMAVMRTTKMGRRMWRSFLSLDGEGNVCGCATGSVIRPAGLTGAARMPSQSPSIAREPYRLSSRAPATHCPERAGKAVEGAATPGVGTGAVPADPKPVDDDAAPLVVPVPVG